MECGIPDGGSSLGGRLRKDPMLRTGAVTCFFPWVMRNNLDCGAALRLTARTGYLLFSREEI